MITNPNDRVSTKEEREASVALVRAVTERFRGKAMYQLCPHYKEWGEATYAVFQCRESEIPYSVVKRITDVCERILAE